MKLVIQRVTEASVSIEENCVGKIGRGYLVLLGVGEGVNEEIAEKMFENMM